MIEEHKIVIADRLKRVKMAAPVLDFPHNAAYLGDLKSSSVEFRGYVHNSDNLADLPSTTKSGNCRKISQ